MSAEGSPVDPVAEALQLNTPYIDSLKTALGAIALEGLQLFFRRAVELFDQIDEAIRAGRAKLAGERLHALKGISWTAGAQGFGESCIKLEGLADEGRLGELAEAHQRLRAAFPPLKSALLQAYA